MSRRLNTSKQYQDEQYDDNCTYDSNATMAISVTVTTEPATEASKQNNHENGEQYCTYGHDIILSLDLIWKTNTIENGSVMTRQVDKPWLSSFRYYLPDVDLV